MPWITLNADAGADRLTETEARVYRERFLKTGAPDPLPEIQANAVAEIRGNVANWHQNTLDTEDGTIPSNLIETARAIIRYRLLSRLPVESLITDARRSEYKDALHLLERVAIGKFAVDQPDAPPASGAPSPSISARTRNFGRSSQDGI